MKRRLATFPARVLQHLGLLVAFILLMAANEFAAAHPALSAILVFIFSLPYLLAAIVARRADFLYGTMLLGAVSYFLACHALGAPALTFPLLAVPLVVALWLVGNALRKRLPEQWAAYPRTVFRAMNITVAAFSVWGIVVLRDVMAEPGPLRYVVALAYLGYAGLYLTHALVGAPTVYSYVFSGFLVLGGILGGLAVSSVEYCWIPTMAAAAIVMLVGASRHRQRGCTWSRHFYFPAMAVVAISLCLSVLRWTFVPLALAVAAMLLWIGYRRLSAAVGDVRRATMAERVVAKYFLLSVTVLNVPVVALALVVPTELHVALGSLIAAATFAWMAWERRGQVLGGERNYILAAGLFASGGLLGLGAQFAASIASAWAIVAPLAVLAALALLGRRAARAGDEATRGRLATAAVFPALWAWLVPLYMGNTQVALVSAATVLVGAVALAAALRSRAFVYAIGPAVAGLVAAGAARAGNVTAPAWALCAAAMAVAAVVQVVARRRPVTRWTAGLAWLVLSAATLALASGGGLDQLLYAAVATGVVSVLVAGRGTAGPQSDLLDRSVQAVAGVATVAAVLLGQTSGVGLTVAGGCLLILSAACGLAMAMRRTAGWAWTAHGLFALGAVLVIFGQAGATLEARLGAMAGVMLALFILGALLRERIGGDAGRRSASVVGQMVAIVAGSTALVQAWSGNTWPLVGIALGYAALNAVMPRLRQGTGFRLATALWVSAAALFALAAWRDTALSWQMRPLAILALVWVGLGYVAGRRGQGSRAQSLYICAGVVAAFCGLMSLFAPAATDSWQVFLIIAAAFAALFLILREDVLAYVLTLSLSLMAYDWVRASTSSFTQDVLFYLVIGGAGLGVFFLLPVVKRLLARTAAIPMISVFTWRGAALFSLPVLGLGALLLSAYSLEITGHPKFCTSCHYMGKYYGSWQHSSHRDVACIKCHYAPGATAEVKGKVAGLVQVVKYVSHSYGTKPHAMISNDSCMRADCHAGMDHNKQLVLFNGKIKFRHSKHLDAQPRGKVLNCVSCHGQTAEGQHRSVTKTTCLTCHFYGRGDQPTAAGECTTCHQIPKEDVTFKGQTFNHVSFMKGRHDVSCALCHNQVTQGDGAVSPTRCKACHLQVPTTEIDQAEFHLIHVSKGQFDCLQCHDEIKHGTHPMDQALLASGNCKTCHGGQRHSLQEQIYAGTAVSGLEVMPDAMYKAGVACTGCHTEPKSADTPETSFTMKASGAKQCAHCHGQKMYGNMLEAWQEETRSQIDDLRSSLAALETVCKGAASTAPADELAQARKLLKSARNKLALVVADGSAGAHNIMYVSAILESATDEAQQCRKLTSKWQKTVGMERTP